MTIITDKSPFELIAIARENKKKKIEIHWERAKGPDPKVMEQKKKKGVQG